MLTFLTDTTFSASAVRTLLCKCVLFVEILGSETCLFQQSQVYLSKVPTLVREHEIPPRCNADKTSMLS